MPQPIGASPEAILEILPVLELFLRDAIGIALTKPQRLFSRPLVELHDATSSSSRTTIAASMLLRINDAKREIDNLDCSGVFAAVTPSPEALRYFTQTSDNREPTREEREAGLRNCLSSIVAEYGARVDSLELASDTIVESVLKNVVSDVGRDLAKTTLSCVTTAYIAATSLEKSYGFGDALSIRPATGEDVASLLSENEPFAARSAFGLSAARAIVRETIEIPAPPWRSPQPAVPEDIWLLIALLRVLSNGTLPIVRAKRFIDSPSFHNVFPRPPLIDLKTGGDAVDLDNGLMATAQQTWAKLKNSVNREAIEGMMRRFSFATDRHRVDDALVDLVIGIEMPLGDQQELTFKVSMRLAAMIGRGEERAPIFRRMQQIYSVRSKVVHGDSPKHEHVATAALDARSYLRSLILAMIGMDGPLQLGTLDERIASGNTS